MIKNRKAVCALFLCMTAALTFLVPPIQAVENKGKSMSAVETLMHSDRDIMELDGMLNHSYRAAMRAVADRKKLKQEQIAWLKTVRNVCKTTDCLEDVYCDRINELHDLEIKALGVIDKPLTDDEVKAIFRTLAKLADNGELSLMAVPGKAFSRLDEADKRAGWGIDPVKLKKIVDYYGYSDFEDWGPDEVFKLRLNPESEPVLFGKIWHPGSCPNSEIFDFSSDIDMMVVQENKEVESTDVSKVENNPDQNEENPDETAESFDGDEGTEGSYWADWGGNDYPIVYRGRYFEVTSDYRNKNHLLQIAWPTRSLFLCKDSHKAVISSDIESLSSGVVTGKNKPLSFKAFKVKKQLKEQLSEHLYEWGSSAGHLSMDIDGDGVFENVGLFYSEVLGGCGGNTVTWMKVLSKDLKRVEKNPLNDLFEHFTRENSPLAVYRHNNRYYIEGVVDESLGLFKIEKGKLVRVSTLKQKTKTDLIRYFPMNPKKKEK